MQYKIIDERNLENRIFAVKIHLSPDNTTDANSIRNTEAGNADDAERTTIDNFLNLALSEKNYSPLDFIDQQGEIYTIKAFKN